jgi:hypothetical protein
MTKSSAARRERRLRRGAGRPKGSRVTLAHDPRRFSMAVRFLLTETGMGRYESAYLASAAIDSTAPITVEQAEQALTRFSLAFRDRRHTPDLSHYADWTVKKMANSFGRATRGERDWIAASVAAIVTLLRRLAAADIAGACLSLDMLVDLGWDPIIERLRDRLAPALGMSRDEADPSVAARLLFRLAHGQRPKNESNINK